MAWIDVGTDEPQWVEDQRNYVPEHALTPANIQYYRSMGVPQSLIDQVIPATNKANTIGGRYYAPVPSGDTDNFTQTRYETPESRAAFAELKRIQTQILDITDPNRGYDNDFMERVIKGSLLGMAGYAGGGALGLWGAPGAAGAGAAGTSGFTGATSADLAMELAPGFTVPEAAGGAGLGALGGTTNAASSLMMSPAELTALETSVGAPTGGFGLTAETAGALPAFGAPGTIAPTSATSTLADPFSLSTIPEGAGGAFDMGGVAGGTAGAGGATGLSSATMLPGGGGGGVFDNLLKSFISPQGLSFGLGLYNQQKTMDETRKAQEQLRQAFERSDPFAPGRKAALDQYTANLANPANYFNSPLARLQLDEFNRAMRAKQASLGHNFNINPTTGNVMGSGIGATDFANAMQTNIAKQYEQHMSNLAQQAGMQLFPSADMAGRLTQMPGAIQAARSNMLRDIGAFGASGAMRDLGDVLFPKIQGMLGIGA